MTVWQTCPQNCTESMYSMPRYAASETMTTFRNVITRTTIVVRRVTGLLRSSVGQVGLDGARPLICRRRSSHMPMGMTARPAMKKPGRIRKTTMPM